jgi:hypothetical protein
MQRALPFLCSWWLVQSAAAAEFKHFGDFLLQAHFKIAGERVIPIPMKSIGFSVYSDGIHVRIIAEDNDEARSTFEIYCSDGIARQRSEGGALEIIPGIQATSKVGGVLRHLRLSRESLTITTFPGVSDQTIVSHAVLAAPINPVAADSAVTPPATP